MLLLDTTAKLQNLLIVTPDSLIHAYPDVQLVW